MSEPEDRFIIEGKVCGDCIETIIKLKCCGAIVYSYFIQLPTPLNELKHNCKSSDVGDKAKTSIPKAKIQELIDGIEKTIHKCRVIDELYNYSKFVSDLKKLIKPEGE